MTFRQVLFWLHLTTGLVCGAVIALLCCTGTLLAFEKELVAHFERDARQVALPAEGAPRLPLAELQRRAREAHPDLSFASMVIARDPQAAVAFVAGRTGTVYVNPYTGEVRRPRSDSAARFMQTMVGWHRWLGFTGEQSRPLGKLVTGAANLAFAGLAVTGLYLWWPRTWSRRGVKAIAVINLRSTGKTRDFNWHNSIGLWSAPILIILTLTAVPISYRWGTNLIYRIAGEEPPVQQGPGGPPAATTATLDIQRPAPDARPASQDAILLRVQQDFPRWEQISFRTGGNQRSARPATGNAAAPRAEGRDNGAAGPQPLTVSIRESGSWPRTATTTLTLNPFTGEILLREGYADLSPARQIRSWTRFLHTGEALGFVGQFVAGLACLGGCFLVYTGFALSWRRFFSRPAKLPPNGTIPH
jgi:uncharacterized iron-regulated membrane protein